MACNCLKTVLEKIEVQLKPKREVLDFKIKWKGSVLRFDGGCGVGLYIESEYRDIKKDGSSYKNLTKSDNFVAMSYCPFCGVGFKEKESEK